MYILHRPVQLHVTSGTAHRAAWSSNGHKHTHTPHDRNGVYYTRVTLYPSICIYVYTLDPLPVPPRLPDNDHVCMTVAATNVRGRTVITPVEKAALRTCHSPPSAPRSLNDIRVSKRMRARFVYSFNRSRNSFNQSSFY